jgi:hypothetical protein
MIWNQSYTTKKPKSNLFFCIFRVNLTTEYSSPQKSQRCPKCGSARIAELIYGEPAYSKELVAVIEEGKIILAGCILTGKDYGCG